MSSYSDDKCPHGWMLDVTCPACGRAFPMHEYHNHLDHCELHARNVHRCSHCGELHPDSSDGYVEHAASCKGLAKHKRQAGVLSRADGPFYHPDEGWDEEVERYEQRLRQQYWRKMLTRKSPAMREFSRPVARYIEHAVKLGIPPLGYSAISGREDWKTDDAFPLVDKETGEILGYGKHPESLRLPFMEVYSGLVKVKCPKDAARPSNSDTLRGDVRGASDKSLRRLREEMQKVRNWRGVLFGTLTYPKDFPEEFETWKAQHQALFKRMARKWPEFGRIWRLELQKRLAPHFHEFLMGLLPGDEDHLPLQYRRVWLDFSSDASFRAKADHFVKLLRESLAEAESNGWYTKARDLQRLLENVRFWRTNWLHAFRIWYAWAWHEIIGSDDVNHLLFGTDVKYVENRKQAQYYISKYMSKADRSAYGQDARAAVHTGRIWGVRGNVDRAMAYYVKLHSAGLAAVRLRAAEYLQGLKSSKAVRYAEKLLDSPVGFTVFGIGDESAPSMVDALVAAAFP